MARAFAQGHRVLREDGVGAVGFAHETTEGWEALLSGLIRCGWTITGSWPLATEMGSRLRARESAALAPSVHLICRPRPSPQSSPTGRECRHARGHDAGPRARRHAAAGWRAHERAACSSESRAGARAVLPPPRQRALRPLPEGHRGEAPARCDASGSAEMKVHHRGTESTEMDLNKITEQIVGAAIEVHKALGPGLSESAYEECPC